MRSASRGRLLGLRAVTVLALTMGVGSVPALRADEGGHDRSHPAERLQEGVAIIKSRALYQENCTECHGKRGRGIAAGGTDFSAPQALVELTQQKIDAAITSGHDGRLTASLSDGDRAAIIGYIRNYLMLPAPDADTELGRTIYAKSCSVCHGDRGDSASWAKNSLNPAPADFTAHSQAQLSRREMIATVTFGADDTAMMPFAVQLSREEVAATVDYIRAAFMPETGSGSHTGPGHDHGNRHGQPEEDQERSDHAHATGADHAHDTGDHDADADDYAELETFPGGLVGDPVWGKSFYEDNCAECHGVDGDGVGPRAYFMNVKPRKFRSYSAREALGRTELFKGISKGVTRTTMPAWEKVLDSQQIANVGEYVYRAFLHPDEFDDVVTPAPSWRPVEPSEAGTAKKN